MNILKKYSEKKIILVFSLGKLILVLMGFFLLIYWLFAGYWYQQVGLSFIKWHTHFMFLISLFVMGGFFIYRTKYIKLLFPIFIFVFILEAFFSITGGNKTLYESEYGYYRSPYLPNHQAHHHIWDPSKPSHELKTAEYHYVRPTNSDGFSDIDWKSDTLLSNKKKILALGDSFTEGDGADMDSSYVSVLNSKPLINSSYRILNGGICGSDPFENYLNLRDIFLSYKPEMVIQTISTNDIYMDIAVKGGFERFVGNDSLLYKKPPVWEGLYAISYVSRMFFEWLGFDQFLVNKSGVKLNVELNETLENLFVNYINLCKKENIQLMIVKLPLKHEILTGNYDFNFSKLDSLFNKHKIVMCDLMPYYRDIMRDSTGNINYTPYYWVKDGHHNAKGYHVMADGIYACISPLLQEEGAIAYRSY